jgi:hypothetical protein
MFGKQTELPRRFPAIGYVPSASHDSQIGTHTQIGYVPQIDGIAQSLPENWLCLVREPTTAKSEPLLKIGYVWQIDGTAMALPGNWLCFVSKLNDSRIGDIL